MNDAPREPTPTTNEPTEPMNTTDRTTNDEPDAPGLPGGLYWTRCNDCGDRIPSDEHEHFHGRCARCGTVRTRAGWREFHRITDRLNDPPR